MHKTAKRIKWQPSNAKHQNAQIEKPGINKTGISVHRGENENFNYSSPVNLPVI